MKRLSVIPVFLVVLGCGVCACNDEAEVQIVECQNGYSSVIKDGRITACEKKQDNQPVTCTDEGMKEIVGEDGTTLCVPDATVCDSSQNCPNDKPHCVDAPNGSVCAEKATCGENENRISNGECVFDTAGFTKRCVESGKFVIDTDDSMKIDAPLACVDCSTNVAFCKNDERCVEEDEGFFCRVEPECESCGDDEKPYCVRHEYGYACSYIAICPEGKMHDDKGLCIKEVITCTLHEDCNEDQLCGKDNTCVPASEAANVYRYVRIDDKSAVTEPSAEPGADIDAVVLSKKSDNTLYYAASVVRYSPADTFAKDAVANDSNKILGAPDAFSFVRGSLENDDCTFKKDDAYTFVSLGGEPGFIEVEMAGPIENGDTLYILELGGCKMTGTEDSESQVAKPEAFSVSIAVTSDGNSWKAAKTFERDTDKGLLQMEVTGL